MIILRYSIVALAAFLIAMAGVASPLPDQLNRQISVSEPFADPAFESVCHLFIRRKAFLFSPKYTGTAVLYRGRYLLTAGHNVYQDHSKIAGVDVRCGSADATAGKIDETIAEWQALDASDFPAGGESRDFGVIRLNRPITVSSPFELSAAPPQSGDRVRFAGYPGGIYTGWKLFQAEGTVRDLSSGIAYYDIQTFKSNSGGPVWRTVGAKSQLVAIHVIGDEARKMGGGRIVDADYVREIDRLIRELDARAAARGL
jgi:V8-like Glu-specific endopeptidase